MMTLEQVERVTLLDCLTNYFNKDDLFALVSSLGIDPDTFSPSKPIFCLELITYTKHRAYTSALIRAILNARPFLQARLAHLTSATVPSAPPSALSPSAVPSPNPLFTGRVAELATLERVLLGEGRDAAIIGMGGLGKTQLASEWVQRHASRFTGGVFWFSFADAEGVAGQVAAHAARLCLDAEALPFAEQVALVQRAWQEPTPRLLVFDNCEEVAQLDAWRPRTGGSRVLLTSRRPIWPGVPRLHSLPLGVLPRAESVALLAKFRPDLSQEAVLGEIAQRLGDLPLALHLAGSYLKRYRHHPALGRPTAYLRRLERPDLLEHPSLKGHEAEDSPTGHDQDVARTIALSYERLDESDPLDALALTLLSHAACLAPGEPIPHDLLLLMLPDAGEEHDEDAEEEAARQGEDALHRLHDLGLIEQQEETGDILLHLPLAAFIAPRLTPATRDAVERAVLIEARFLNEAGYPLALRPLLPHLRHLTDLDPTRADEQAASLCNELGYLLKSQGDYGAARPYFECALAIFEAILGPTHPDTATSLNNLGLLLSSQGDYGAARPYYERALAIHETMWGPIHPATARTLNNLGYLLDSQGDYEAACPYYERALAIREEVLGPTHPDTARSLNNLGALLSRQGDYAAARTYYERALVIYEAVLGPTHPTTATSLNNLGALLDRQGEYAAAHAYYKRALAIHEAVLGPTHPDTATSLNNLGYLLASQGDYEAARPYYERALAIYETVLGPIHPDTATSLNNLGVLLYSQGDYAAARVYYERAMVIHEAVLGPSHPDTARSLNNLGMLLHSQGDYAAARPYYERALAIVETALGPSHPATARSLNNMGMLLHSQGDYAAARPYYERALAIYGQVLGAEHPNTVSVRGNLQRLDAREGRG